jgi:type II secretory pathway component PulJ
MRRHARGQSGTTIVEIAVGLAVGTVLVAGILMLIEQTQQSYIHSSEVTDLQQSTRVGMDRVVRVIQAAGVNPLNLNFGGATPNEVAFAAFREAGRNCIRVYADLNGDGNLNVGGQAEEADENVYFHWSTTAGEALREQRGTTGGQPDAGQGWVAAGTGAEDLARDIVANPGGTDMFQYFTGPNDPLGAPNTQLVPPAASTTACASLTDAQRQRVARVIVTLTGRAIISGQTLTKTVTSDARARNVP